MNYRIFIIIFSLIAVSSVLFGCSHPGENPTILTIEIVDGENLQQVSLSDRESVGSLLGELGILIGQLDMVSPPINTIIDKSMRIVITRISEIIETRQLIIPYDRQELPNESMAAGEVRLIQAGKSGLMEQQIRHVYQDGKEVSSAVVSEVIIETVKPEIIMVGVLTPFQSVSIPSKLVYLNSGNAWLMETSTANRIPLVTSGDLDGRIFSLSPDGTWLLFSRSSTRPSNEEINNLWIINLTNPDSQIIDLHVSNIIHFAEWQPGKEYIIAYSTVEPREAAPGWQANNDLFFLPIHPETGVPDTPIQILENSSGGIYGWWGTSFSWSADGSLLAFSRPDGIGLVNVQNNNLSKLIDIVPLNTYSDWAWISGIEWSNDNKTLYYTAHRIDSGYVSPEDSPIFDFKAYLLPSGQSILLAADIGMFTYPAISLVDEDSMGGSLLGYLNAIFPSQSATSRYRIYLMDRDGSEQRLLFPAESIIGIFPKMSWGAWAPNSSNPLLGVLYEGNIWIIDVVSGLPQQITGDGLTRRIDWK